MNNISPHVSYSEGVVSATGKRLGIDNTPTPQILATMRITAETLFEPLRLHFKAPIRIISFYRCQKLNKAVGGAKGSQHMLGEAIDIQGTSGVTNMDIFHYLLYSGLAFDQIIYEFGNDIEPDWVHISYTDVRENRKEALRARKVNGKTVYEPFKK